jgi:uncharacterized membrane protein
MSNKTARPVESYVCVTCGQNRDKHLSKPLALIGHPIDDLIRQAVPDLAPETLICSECRDKYRRQFMEETLAEEKGDLTALEHAVLESLTEHENISRNVNHEFEGKLSFGDRLADRIASFGGSWHFIILFGIVLAVWIGVNSFLLLMRPFDPYPFILLNLILSCMASIQAPVIMMSQNRQAARDRLNSELDYKVNLKAEIEIKHLNMKIDQLLNHQWQRLMEIQQMQLEVLDEMQKAKQK